MNNDILQLAAMQGGVIRTEQAIARGISPSSITRRVRNGQWQRLARAVYRVFDMDSPLDRVRAALTALPTAVASHETAAELHDIGRLPRDHAVVTVHAKTTHVFPGVIIHRTRDLAESHITKVGDIETTTIERTVVDLAAQLHPRHLEAIVDDLVAAKRLELALLGTLVGSLARRGKPGSTVLRDLIAHRQPGDLPLASRLERLGMAVLLKAGLPTPQTEWPAPWDTQKRIDAAYPRSQVGIEWDSRQWHSRVEDFQRDRQRDRNALLHGWRVFRFTWHDVTARPHDVVDTIRTALNRPFVAT